MGRYDSWVAWIFEQVLGPQVHPWDASIDVELQSFIGVQDQFLLAGGCTAFICTWSFFRFGFFWFLVPRFAVLFCFFASLLLCFSAFVFLLFPASLLFCFFAFPASSAFLLFPLLCFFCICASLLVCFFCLSCVSAFLLLCFFVHFCFSAFLIGIAQCIWHVWILWTSRTELTFVFLLDFQLKTLIGFATGSKTACRFSICDCEISQTYQSSCPHAYYLDATLLRSFWHLQATGCGGWGGHQRQSPGICL